MSLLVGNFLVLFCFLQLLSPALLEAKTLKNDLYSVDIPDGWDWAGNERGLDISSPNRAISIGIFVKGAPLGWDLAKEINSFKKTKTMNSNIARRHLVMDDQKDIILGKISCRELDYEEGEPGWPLLFSRNIFCLGKGNAFSMFVSSVPRRFDKVSQKILQSIQFN